MKQIIYILFSITLTVARRQCNEYMIRFENDCHKILTRGPCKDDELLTLDKTIYMKDKVIRPVCVKKLCTNDDEVWWPDEKKCLNVQLILDTICKHTDPIHVATNLFNEGVCSCIGDASGLFKDGNKCHNYYESGPCGIGKVVTYDITSGYATCGDDKCLSAKNNRTDIEINENVNYAPLNGNGECVPLYTNGLPNYRIKGFLHVPVELFYLVKYLSVDCRKATNSGSCLDSQNVETTMVSAASRLKNRRKNNLPRNGTVNTDTKM